MAVKVVVDVIDFGPVTLEPSPDNPECLRMTIHDEVGSGLEVRVDLENSEIDDLVNALTMMKGRL